MTRSQPSSTGLTSNRSPAVNKLIPIILIAALAGCFPAGPGALSLNEAEKKLIEICKDEYQLNIRLFRRRGTLWIYVPTNEPLFDYKAGREGPKQSDQAVSRPAINFLDGEFESRGFTIRYDIGPLKSYPQDYGYTNVYSDGYQKVRQDVMTAVMRSLMDNPPEVLVIVIADVKRGMESTMLIDFDDFKRSLSDTTFMEEYAKRLVTELPIGDPDIIVDLNGRHLQIREITMPDFLTRQILHRIRFKYQQSDFPPEDNPETEILKIVGDAVDAYGFTDFRNVGLHNLATKERFVFTQSQLGGR